MAYSIVDPILGAQPIADTSTTQRHPLGQIVNAVDPTLGAGEFIYLKGIASTVVGTPVIYWLSTGVTQLAPVGTNKNQPVAFAMAATTAALYGWYQIAGYAVAAKTSALALASNAAVGILTVGKVAASASGKEISGAVTVAKATTPTTVTLHINRPHMMGRVT
jgi:hypothetical protein